LENGISQQGTVQLGLRTAFKGVGQAPRKRKNSIAYNSTQVQYNSISVSSESLETVSTFFQSLLKIDIQGTILQPRREVLLRLGLAPIPEAMVTPATK
jgi:hypothetical protein